LGGKGHLSAKGGAVAGFLAVALGGAAAPASAEPAVRSQVRIEDPRHGIAVSDAIRGALGRLEDARCRAVFSDFEASSGRSLQQALEDRQETPQARLERVLFEDGSRRRGCQAPSRAAFTVPGTLVVYVCGRAFSAAAERSRAFADAAIIHELLHTLGLGEDPPTSKEITDAVMARCAR
jgi:hypothetical protein